MNPDITLPKEKAIKVYTALLTQTGTNAPTAIILQNTLGGIPTWTRNSQGNYYATLEGAFKPNKTFLSITQCNATADGQMYFVESTVDAVSLTTTSDLSSQIDGALQNTCVEIRVYQ